VIRRKLERGRARQTQHGVLGRHVRRLHGRGDQGPCRGGVDDRATAGLAQFRNRVLHPVEHAAHVDVEDALEHVVRVVRHKRAVAEDARVVVQRVEPSEALHGGLDHALHRRRVADVNAVGDHLATRARRDLVDAFVDVPREHACSAAHELGDGGCADAAGGARDDDGGGVPGRGHEATFDEKALILIMIGMPPGVSRPLSSEEFRDVIGHFASGVTVVTVAHAGKSYGTTANAVSSLSLEPPMVLICINKTSSTAQAITASHAFAINILNEEQHALARNFATKNPDKFEGVLVTTGAFGQPLLGDALATIECEVVEEVTGGTHTVFLAAVRSATSHEGAPLAYFRGEFGRLEVTRDRPIYVMIRERLLARELPVGRQLELPELAQGLDVPAGALYYALGRLSSEGMLERTGTGRFVVPPVTAQSLDGAVDATCAIELGAVDMTIGRVPAEDLARWREQMETFAAHVQPGHFIDIDTSLDANTRFHETLVGFTGSESLLDLHRRAGLPGILARAFEPHISRSETDKAYGEDHRDIVDAVEAGDAEAARRAIVRHGERIKTAFRAGLAETGAVL